MLRSIVLAALVLATLTCQALAEGNGLPAGGGPATCGGGTLDPAAIKPGIWYKRTPLPDAPRNPRMGYEAAWAYDPFNKVILRWGAHNQGGGGEQNSEMWVYNPVSNVFKLMEPNYSPPGACCNRDNVFDAANRRYIRFPAHSANHGWQWRREVFQGTSSVWTYDLATNQWRNMRPMPEASPGPMRGADYDSNNDVTVVAQGEGVHWGTAVYDLYTNTWTMMNAKNEPPERNTFGFAYDPAGRKFISFGSQTGNDPKTWVYDLRKNEWQGLTLDPHPPAAANGAVLAYDPLHKVMLCVVLTHKDGIDPEDKKPAKVPDALETWAIDPLEMVWKKLSPPQPPDVAEVRNRQLLFVPELNAFVLEERTGKEQQMWLYRYADYVAAKDAPPASPTEVKAQTDASSVTLTWKPSEGKDVASYVIYRGSGEKPWLVDYKKLGTAQATPTGCEFKDTTVQPGNVYYYYVAAINKADIEGPASHKARSQPPVVVDMVVSVANPKTIELTWEKGGPDVAGYNVYRAPMVVWSSDQAKSIRDLNKLKNPPAEPTLGTWKRPTDFVKLTDKPATTNSFTDSSVDLSKAGPTGLPQAAPDKSIAQDGKPYKFAVYAYRVTAVNKLGVESGPSPYYLTVPGPVSDLKSRERKGETDLRWSVNKEKDVVGYRVYRMEGRFNDAAVTLLTAEPLKATTFTDKIANSPNDDAKRYYVVAVDGLGQEGIVGSPTWGNREYAKYYVGFLEEWHQ